MATQLDCYGILQVHPKAEKEVIDAAYRQLASKYHPDVSQVSDASERMKQINTAYEVLSDPIKRAAYGADRGLVPPTDTPPHAAARSRYLTNAWRTLYYNVIDNFLTNTVRFNCIFSCYSVNDHQAMVR